MKDFEQIRTDRLTIRRLVMPDKLDLFAYRSLPEVSKYQGFQPKTMKDAEDFIRKNESVGLNVPGTWLQLAVCLNDGTVIGDIGIHFSDAQQVEVGYTLSPAHQGKGYATEAVKAVVDYLFSGLLKHRVYAYVDPDNEKSIRLVERLRFRKEAHFIKFYRIGDQWHDDCVYAILKEEWE